MIDGPDAIADVQVFDVTLSTVDEANQIFAIEAGWS
jgi:hypothetical protein